MIVLAARREGREALCNADTQCTSSAGRSQIGAALECATTSTPSQEKAIHASLSTPTRTVPGATSWVINASRTLTLGQMQRREAAAKQGPTRSTARPSKVIASTLLNATPMSLASLKPKLASLDSIGSVNVTRPRDGLATESNVWTATAHSAQSPISELRVLLPSLMESKKTHLLG